MKLDLGTDWQIWKNKTLQLEQKKNTNNTHTDKCHYKSPLVTRTITIIIVIIITIILAFNYLRWNFSFSHIWRAKNRQFGRKETVTDHSICECGRMHVISCNSILPPPGCNHGDGSWKSLLYLFMFIVDFHSKSQRLCRQIGSDPRPSSPQPWQ